MLFFLIVSLVLATLGFIVIGNRRPIDVAVDLSESCDVASLGEDLGYRGKRTNDRNRDELFQAGLLTKGERQKFTEKLVRIPILTGVGLGFLGLLLSKFNPLIGLLLFCLGLSGGFLYMRLQLASLRAQFVRNINFHLPLVMERLVMAAQAGLDVFSSLRVVTEMQSVEKGGAPDPVTQLLERVYRLTERGLGFEEALRQVSQQVENPALRHAFVHLAVAQKEGGELVTPLRELSDSTHSFYQETVEEEIARLPVKATLPLLLTFGGLILFFLSAPIIQIMKLTAESTLP
ncbi:MAG: type II secretion system F family protein [Bdellovibrionales bacterium]|nr:type II secretion system F family protein [Bdellovibrionales bacterium]